MNQNYFVIIERYGDSRDSADNESILDPGFLSLNQSQI